VIYETFEGNKCIFFIGKCSKFSSVTLNFSEVYPNCFGSLKGCVTDITVCEFFLENYIVYYDAKKIDYFIYFYVLSLPSAIYRSPEN